MELRKFQSVKEFVLTLIHNEGVVFFDEYGRQWRYQNHGFTFKDICRDSKHEDGLKCVHLFGTNIYTN